MVVLGRLFTPYGIKGWLHLHPFGDDPASWRHMAQWWLAPEDSDKAQWSAAKLSGLRLHGGGWVAKLEGVDSREAAEAMAGWYFAAPRAELPATGSDEYYWADLIGLQVFNTRDEPLGRVLGLIATSANDVLRVGSAEVAARGKDRERLLPFVAAVVLDVDLQERRMRVDWEADW